MSTYVKEAIDFHELALVIHREIGYRAEGAAFDNLGLAYKEFGDVDKAQKMMNK